VYPSPQSDTVPLKSFFHAGKGTHFSKDVILTSVRWYMAYLLSTRHVEELCRTLSIHDPELTIAQC
jgi:transposase-like protein